MPRPEPSANGALGAALGETLPALGVRFENTRQIVEIPNLRPDILIAADGGRGGVHAAAAKRDPLDFDSRAAEDVAIIDSAGLAIEEWLAKLRDMDRLA